MKKAKKIIAGSLVLALSVTAALTGCSNRGGDDPNEEVTLKWVYMGDMQQDTQKVWDAFNEKLKEYLPNTKVEFEAIPGAEYAEKWKLKMASREAIDIAWTGYTSTYVDEIANGSFMELNDLLDQYGQDVKAELPDWVWEKAEFNGKIYSIPNYQMMNVLRLGIKTPKVLADEFMPAELEQRITETCYSHPLAQKEDYDVIGEYLQNLKDGGKLWKGVAPENLVWLGQRKGYEQLMSETQPYVMVKTDPNFKVINVFEQDSMKVAYAGLRDWYEKGFIRQDISGITDYSDGDLVEGGYVLNMHGHYDMPTTKQAGKLEEKSIPVDDKYYISASQSNTSTAIPNTAKHPERAMELLNLMNTEKGKDLLNLLAYGIEGEHYDVKDNNQINVDKAVLAGTQKKYQGTVWVLGNVFNAYETDNNPVGLNDYYLHEVNEKAEVSTIMGFKPDLNPVKTEVSQVEAVTKEFEVPLRKGYLSNWQETYDEMISKMKGAGIDTVIAEIQSQLDTWRAENNK